VILLDWEGLLMTANTVFAHLFRRRPKRGHIADDLFNTEKVICLPPTLTGNELPPEFEDILQVQVLGYRERLTILHGQRQRVLDPVWTLVPK
jgi:hypothetical protein